jgi:CBS domain-containing protein
MAETFKFPRPGTVADVMTTPAICVTPRARFKDIVKLLDRYGISAVPVVDEDRHVVGIVSEADLILKEDLAAAEHPRHESRRHEAERAKAEARLGWQLMTPNVLTVGPTAPLSAAARLMHENAVKRIPVVDEEARLVGVVSRHDVLKVFLRSDTVIRQDVEVELARFHSVSPGTVKVAVRDGVVTLEGEVDHAEDIELIQVVAGSVDGVVDVRAWLTLSEGAVLGAPQPLVKSWPRA